MRAVALALALVAAALSGCGGSIGDLMSISTTGGGGPGHRFVVTGDGRGRCDRAAMRTLPSDHVLDAREVERELVDPIKAHASYSAGPPGARRYVATTKDGLISWVEGARGAPPVVGKAILLTQELKRDLCPGASGP